MGGTSRKSDSFGSSGALPCSSRGAPGAPSAPLVRSSSRAEAYSRGGHVVSIQILGVSFGVSKSSIEIRFTTTVSAGCVIYGGEYVAEPIIEIWHTALSPVHGTEHIHTKYGLSASTPYIVYFSARDADGIGAKAPSEAGYYVVDTANNAGLGGGLLFIIA